MFWVGPAFSLYEADPRWGHNFALPILFVLVGLAYYFRKLSCDLVAVVASFLTVPTELAFWYWREAAYVAAFLLVIMIILFLFEKRSKVELINPKPRMKAWLKIHLLNLAILGLAHMPLLFFLVRWFYPTPFMIYLPVENGYRDLSTIVFNAMLFVLVPIAVMQRYVKRIYGIDTSRLAFLWTVLMIAAPLVVIAFQ
jgi:hypothetical protein